MGENVLIEANKYTADFKKKDKHMRLTNCVSINKDKIKTPVWELENNKCGF